LSENRNIYPLAALNQSLERFLRDNFAHKSFWVIAEITKVQEKNGHHYLELADSKDGKRIAEMSANMWFSAYNKVNEHLKGELQNIFKAGNKILVNVKIEFHTIYGLKLNIINVDPSITYGEIDRKKKETIERLKKEGVFSLQHEKQLPAIIKKIALIGSQNTSGYRDFLTELSENNIFTNFKVKEFSATVQGENAEKSVVAAIKNAQKYSVDIIVIVRGGGSKMDLNVFNSYAISAEICKSRIPVITGIGHETDEVVADLVANNSQITPTAVAKFLSVRAGVFRTEVRTAFDGVIKNALSLIATYKDEFNHTSKYLVYFTQRLLKERNEEIQLNIHQLQLGIAEAVENERSKLQLYLSKTVNNALNKIELKRSTELTAPFDKIALLTKNTVDRNRIGVENLSELLNLLNPDELLKKGYTISTIENKDLVAYKGDMKGKTLKTLTHENLITSKIIDVK